MLNALLLPVQKGERETGAPPPPPDLRTHLRVVGFSCYSCWLFFSCYFLFALVAFLFLLFLLAFLFLLFFVCLGCFSFLGWFLLALVWFGWFDWFACFGLVLIILEKACVRGEDFTLGISAAAKVANSCPQCANECHERRFGVLEANTMLRKGQGVCTMWTVEDTQAHPLSPCKPCFDFCALAARCSSLRLFQEQIEDERQELPSFPTKALAGKLYEAGVCGGSHLYTTPTPTPTPPPHHHHHPPTHTHTTTAPPPPPPPTHPHPHRHHTPPPPPPPTHPHPHHHHPPTSATVDM